MARYSFYVDGFNMYYALMYGRRFACYKWLDYRNLAERKIYRHDTVGDVVYFTSLVSWKPDSDRRHKTYIKALRSAGVEVVLGRFKRKQIICHKCDEKFWTHEEKRTDVNIALRVVADAHNDRFDKAVLVSADSDLLPVMDTVRKLTPDKEVGLMLPIRRRSDELRDAADFVFKMHEKDLRSAQFPHTIDLGQGVTVQRPASWPKLPATVSISPGPGTAKP